MIVDSCYDTNRREHPALRYLEALGLDPAACVHWIVCSHWHTDHTKGIVDLIQRCPDAPLYFAESLDPDTLAAIRELLDGLGPSVRPRHDFGKALEALAARPHPVGKPSWLELVKAHEVIVNLQSENAPQSQVWVLSPSSAAVTMAYNTLLAAVKSSPRPPIEPRPNDNAIALWVRVGAVTLLLGADLEDNPNRVHGWKAVLESYVRPRGPADLFKVSHHGAKSGHHDEVWATMLTSDVTAVLTQFRGGVTLPTIDDRVRLCERAGSVYIATDIGFSTPKTTTRRGGRTLHPTTMGQVQARRNQPTTTSPTSWEVNLSPRSVCLAPAN
jgi:hypothetical protein